MDKKFLINIIAGFFIFTQFPHSLANVTDATEWYQTTNKNQPTDILTTISSSEASHLIPTTNATTDASVAVTEISKRKKKRLLQERPRRQGYGYGSYPAKYGINTLFNMCPPLATTCPICTNDGVQVPPGFCNSVVLKVLAISAPQIDGNGRVCGKFGMLKFYGNFNEKEFRRLLRFSVSETCGCVVKASAVYFLISPLSTFLKDGLLFNQIVLTEQAVLISADRYIEDEILEVLNSCAVGGGIPPHMPDPYIVVEPPPSVPYAPPPTPYVPPPTKPPAPYVPPATNPPTPYVPPVTKPPVPYVPPATKPPSPYVSPPAPYVPQVINPPAPYVHPPAPYVPPPTEPPAVYSLPPAPPTPYNPPPVVPPAQYNPPAVQLPVATSYQVRPVPAQISSKPAHIRGKIPFLYPSITQCLIPDSCPVCARLDNAGDITGQYCVAGFAYLAVIRVPDASLIQGAESSYSGPTCMNLRTNIVYDITRTRDPQIVVNAMTALLPTKCLTCFAGLSGPVIVLIMGQVPPVPPVAQLDASFQVYILPVPVTITLPSCGTYSMYGSLAVPYSLLPIAPQPYAANDCPEAGDQTCPLCQNYPDASFAEACANGFAIITELNLAGPYFTSQRLPAISVKTTTTYYSKSVEVVIAEPPSIECIKGFFKIIQSIGLEPLNFPGEIIPFVSLPNCECLSQGFKQLLIFSSGPVPISQEGVLHLSKDINIAFLQPNTSFPTCGPSLPAPPPYLPPQPFYIPPDQVPPSSYARPARVPLTYIPPPPPPPAYIPPTDPPPVYILPPDYIPPPVKDSSALPSNWYIPQQLTTLPPPMFFPDTQPPPYTTELPFAETSQIIACTEFNNGSCVVVEANQDKETPLTINVDEDIPFPPQFEALNSLIYEDAPVWSPSFEECLCSKDPSCPHSLEDSSEKFEEFFCKAKTALIVAVGIDYSIVGNETTATKRLTFIQPELPYIGIDYEDPNNPVSLKITVTRNKTMDRRIQLQNNADYCYKEKVLVLSDISNVLKPREVVGTLDIYIPGFCDSEIFDKIPSYGILLSLQQPSDVKNPVQLTEDFSFIPLPEGKLNLPDCGKLIDKKTSVFESSNTKFWVPKSPMETVLCELSEDNRCGAWTIIQDESFLLPCDVRSAALVLVQNTSAGNSVGPTLEILETSYESGEKVITLTVESNIDDEDIYTELIPNDSDRCKYATVKILKDLSRRPSINEDDVLTIIANSNCDNPIFRQTNEVVLLLSDELFFPDTVVPLDHTEVIVIPPGTTKISFCNADLLDEVVDETPLEVKPSYDETITSVDQDSFPDELVIDTSSKHEDTSDTNEVPSNVESYEALETSCIGHIDDTCPVCEDISSISSDVYCNSELSLFAEVVGQELAHGNCTNGVIASLFDITVRNEVPESKVLKISYTIPSHCSCPSLQKGGLLVLILNEATPISNELSISLSQGKYLYSTPLRTSFPSCKLEDSVQARSKDVDNFIVFDSPYEELHKILPELSRNVCPTIDHTCPVCRSMDDKELEHLYCNSEEVLLVSRSKSQKENPEKISKIGKATFTQHKIASNYTLEMSIDEYESSCGLPLAVGNCSESLDRYYFDIEDETCYDFEYSGCGGNTNNFISQKECEKRCFVEDFCEEGILDIKKVVKNSDNANYFDNKFHYTLPEHCNYCSQMLKGDKKGYLISTKEEDLSNASVQLNRNYYFVPLSKKHRNKQFFCTSDGNTAYSSKSNTRSGEAATNNADLQTDTSVKSKKKSGFFSFG